MAVCVAVCTSVIAVVTVFEGVSVESAYVCKAVCGFECKLVCAIVRVCVCE